MPNPTPARLHLTVTQEAVTVTQEASAWQVSLANYPKDTVAAVAAELQQRCNAALRAGVARWNIIVDPGIGTCLEA